MGCGRNLKFTRRLHQFTIYLLFFLISFSTHLSFIAEGRPLVKPIPQSQEAGKEEKAIVRPHIGSRPPSCESKCSSCGHCEAIQVPTNPNIKDGSRNNSTTVATIAYSRGDDYSNYKPMSWKCKCGNLIFNP